MDKKSRKRIRIDSDSVPSSSSSDSESSNRKGGSSSKHKDKKRTSRKKHHKSLPEGVHKLTKDDFYQKTAPFTHYLYDVKGLHFQDLQTKKARQLFKRFIKKWNNGVLESTLYLLNNACLCDLPNHFFSLILPTEASRRFGDRKDILQVELYGRRWE